MLVAIPFVALRGGEAVEPETDPLFRMTVAATIFGFFVGFWTWKGRTLGMQSWRLQLETLDGGTAGFGRASLRFFAAVLSWAPAGLGFIWQLWDPAGLACTTAERHASRALPESGGRHVASPLSTTVSARR